MENNHAANAKVFKAFCDENRLQILELLQTGEKCACVLLEDLNISQPTLSHHMKILCDSGIVIGRKEGKWTHYSISAEGAEAAQALLKSLTTVTVLESVGEAVCG
ncbi:ArsR family transcriptional regulator [Clostridiales Family XIII bacterium PM5-7]|nr:metalloregulator ArsR/SmtB family transcription factor [Ruminococcaceae bacterium OttesenSCG-928-I18]